MSLGLLVLYFGNDALSHYYVWGRVPHPRLIPVEVGSYSLALRTVQRLVHKGDAMQETWAWADGSLYLTAMLRLINRDVVDN